MPGNVPLTTDKVYQLMEVCDADAIVNRITYILEQIDKGFKIKLCTWYFNDAEENSVGRLNSSYHDDVITFFVDYYKFNDLPDMRFTDKDDNIILLHGRFPTRWLTENFEEELTNGIINIGPFIQKQKIEKAKKKQVLDDKYKVLVFAIQKKLLPEELKLCFRADFKYIFEKWKEG